MTRIFRKGFTLIELLIAIAVVGILASMMFISAAEMESSAKATQIIANLKQLKTAASLWYWDNYGRLVRSEKDGYTIDGVNYSALHALVAKDNTIILRYFSNASISLNKGTDKYNDVKKEGLYAALNGYSVYVGNSNREYYVLYRLSTDNNQKDNARLRAKLKARAKTSGLIYYANKKNSVYNGENVVGMLVMTLSADKK